jgi:hypothetical protein
MASTTTLNVSDAYSTGDDDRHDASNSRLLRLPVPAIWSRNANNGGHLSSSPSFFPNSYSSYKPEAQSVPNSSNPVFGVSSLLNLQQIPSAQKQLSQCSNGSIAPDPLPSSKSNAGRADLFSRGGVDTMEVTTDTVGKYATFLLQRNSPEEYRSSIDDSLGPYIISILTEFIQSASATTRRALSDGSVTLQHVWNDYENVLELILEHCSMSSRDVASQTLQDIFYATSTKTVSVALMREYESYMDAQKTLLSYGKLEHGIDETNNSISYVDVYNQYQQQTMNHYFVDKDFDDIELESLVGQMMFHDNEEEEEAMPQATRQEGKVAYSEKSSSYISPHPVGSDIPLENRNSPVNFINTVSISNSPNSASSVNGSLTVTDNSKSQPPRPSKSTTGLKEQKKRSKAADDMLAKDVAAALFKPSRPRSNSNLSDSATTKRNNATTVSPKLMPQAALSTSPPNFGFLTDNSSNAGYFPTGSYLHQEQDNYQDVMAQQIEATAELLLSIQNDLSTNAAWTASMMAYGDVNIAYYLIEQALNAPPICRHMLQYACYRADCAFSHDVDGHTCTFWLKGRCGKGDSCRFLHGFNEALLKDVMDRVDQSSSTMVASDPLDHLEHQPGQTEDSVGSFCAASGGAIVTQNLLLHNEKQKKDNTIGRSSGSPYTSTRPLTPGSLPPDLTLNNSWSSSSMQPHVHAADFSGTAAVSFAKVAASNSITAPSFSLSSAVASNQSSCSSNVVQKEKVKKIPQDLWTCSTNRDPSLFHIVDPIERFHAVNDAQIRAKQLSSGLPHVMDLHFQSVKTAQIVLATVLPQKLEEISKLSQREAGVWIITGSGHHVNTQSHQKRNGVLENAVLKWLQDEGYEHFIGKDRNGFSGAIYVTTTARKFI